MSPDQDLEGDAPAKPAGRVKQTRARVNTWMQPHVERADESIIGRYYNRLLEMEFIDRSIALAAKLFISFFPFVIAIAVFSPQSVRDSLRDALTTRMGLEGQALESVKAAFGSADQSKAAIGVAGLIFLFFYATSFTTALQRTYLRAWRRPSGGGLRNQSRGLLWITGVIIFSVVSGFAGRMFSGWLSFLSALLLMTLNFLLWWWTSRIMVRGEVKWRALLPGAVANAICLALYVLSAQIWMPRNLETNEAQFGFFGVTLALVTYFVGVSFVIVMSAALAPILSEGHGPFAHWLCGGGEGPLTQGARPSLPGPTHRLTIAAALGLPSRKGEPDEEVE